MEKTVYFTITKLYKSHYSIKTKNTNFIAFYIEDCVSSSLFANMDSITTVANLKGYACLFEVN